MGIGIDPFESLEEIETFRESHGYPWPMTNAESDFFRDYNILVRATKVGVDTNGVIIWREGYGTTSSNEWHQVFQDLAS
ncbi:MAG: hypothetical protein O7F09_01690 [Chloroflexi bacterium]|nr:hypothetical protein [Chloroflexota bacterium]MCZ6891208.1 hypothetical protein [Chloroflexota bacterium]